MTHFRPAPSGLPGIPTLRTTTTSGARAAPRPRPRPPPACHLPPGRARGDGLAAFREGRPRLRPVTHSHRAAPRDPEGERRGAGRERPAEARRWAGLPSLRLAPL